MNPSPYNSPWYEEVASLWNIMGSDKTINEYYLGSHTYLYKGNMCNKSWGLFSAGKHVWQHIWGYGLTNITSTFIVFLGFIHSGWLRDGCWHLDEFIRWNIMIGVWWTWLDGLWCLKFGSTWNGTSVSVLTCMWHWLDTTQAKNVFQNMC